MDMKSVLQKAREVYGSKNQILVCVEELNELSSVLTKYPRYENEEEAKEALHDRILDEVADVMIILDHVQNIMGLTAEEVYARMNAKVERLERWLANSDSFQHTLEDRAVIDCHTCAHKLNSSSETLEADAMRCTTCIAAEATDGVKPFYKPLKR